MDLFNITLLKKTAPLNEANEPNKYALPDDVVNGTNDTTAQDVADSEFNTANDPTNNTVGEVPEDNGSDNTEIEKDQSDPTEDDGAEEGETGTSDDPTSVANDIEPDEDSQEFSSDDTNADGTVSEDDITGDAQNAPGLRLLTSLSDKQYNLLNAELLDKFVDLKRDIDSLIHDRMPNIRTTPNPRLTQAYDIAYNNATAFKNDITNYITYTWSSSYESNMVVYATMLTRYKTLCELVHGIQAAIKKDMK